MNGRGLPKAKFSAKAGMPSPKGQVVKPGYGMKHQLRKGTMFPGMDATETGVSDQLADYARMAAAGGGLGQ